VQNAPPKPTHYAAKIPKIDGKSAILHQRGHFDPKLQVRGVAPHQSFLQLVRPMNALQLCR